MLVPWGWGKPLQSVEKPALGKGNPRQILFSRFSRPRETNPLKMLLTQVWGKLLVPETSKYISAPKTCGISLRFLRLPPTVMTDSCRFKNSLSMATRWHFDRTVTQREILEQNRHHKHLFVVWSTLKTDGFWHVFGSMGFLQLDEEKLRELNIFQSRSLFLSRQSKKESE